MPSKSKSQQRLMGWAHSCASGKNKNCPPHIKKIAKSFKMGEGGLKSLKDFAKTKHKGLPEEKSEGILGYDDFLKESIVNELHSPSDPEKDRWWESNHQRLIEYVGDNKELVIDMFANLIDVETAQAYQDSTAKDTALTLWSLMSVEELEEQIKN